MIDDWNAFFSSFVRPSVSEQAHHTPSNPIHMFRLLLLLVLIQHKTSSQSRIPQPWWICELIRYHSRKDETHDVNQRKKKKKRRSQNPLSHSIALVRLKPFCNRQINTLREATRRLTLKSREDLVSIFRLHAAL